MYVSGPSHVHPRGSMLGLCNDAEIRLSRGIQFKEHSLINLYFISDLKPIVGYQQRTDPTANVTPLCGWVFRPGRPCDAGGYWYCASPRACAEHG